MANFQYLGKTVTSQNLIREDTEHISLHTFLHTLLNALVQIENESGPPTPRGGEINNRLCLSSACCNSAQNLSSSCLLPKIVKVKIYKTYNLPTWAYNLF
jgi:hypothetical protein